MLLSAREYSGATPANEHDVTSGHGIRPPEAKRKPNKLRGDKRPERSLFQVLQEIFEEQTDARPAAVAVVFDREKVGTT